MRQTSDLYRSLMSDPAHYFEVSVVIGDRGRLINESGLEILFGGYALVVQRNGAEGGYKSSSLISLSTSRAVFGDNEPSVGNCISGEINLKMLKPNAVLPRMAQIIPFVRVTNGVEHSEWLQKGLYYLDTREFSFDGRAETLTLHGYDPLLMLEQLYPEVKHSFPCSDIDAVRDIAYLIGVPIDENTLDEMNYDYQIEEPGTYTCREVLSYIGALYGGNWIINDIGALQLVRFTALPEQTNYLIDHVGNAITFGEEEVRILV